MSEPPSTVASLDLSAAQRAALAQLVEANAPEDLRDVLARTRDLEPVELLDLLVLDQAQRWQRGQRIPAEAYLRLCPILGEDTDAAFELVYSEFVLRQEAGDAPALAEYVWRFPQFAERLRRQASLFETLVSAEEPTPFTLEGQLAETETEPAPRGNWPHIEGFEILGELGRGGMAVVYKARQRSLNRTVALKLIRDSALADADQRQRFRREAEVVARLQHPHIVQIHEIGEEDGLPYLCLEYVAGGSLARAVQGTPQAPQDAARLVETLAQAIDHAHRQGIIHRDLKPANVLVQRIATDEHRLTQMAKQEKQRNSDSSICVPPCSSVAEFLPKITDFGLAKRWTPVGAAGSAGSPSGAIVGTAEYMAPEQAQAKPDAVGPAADIYALGAILYELLTGRPPFKAAAPLDTLLLVLHEEPIPPTHLQPKVPRDLETICLKCLEKAPARRYGSAADLAEDLRRFRAGEPIRARPVGWGERAAKWARRRPALAALLGVSLAATVSLGLFGVWHTRELQARISERDRQKERADDNLRRAVDALDQLVFHAQDLDRTGLPELEAIQGRQMEAALRFYEGILEHPDNSTSTTRLQRSLTHSVLGKLYLVLDKPEPAREQFAAALALQEALADEFPDEPAYRLHLAATCERRAYVTQDLTERVAHLQRAAGLLADVRRQDPNDHRARKRLATVCHNLGETWYRARQWSQSEEAYQQALELKEARLRQEPASLEAVTNLALTCSGLAVLLSDEPRREQARALLERARQLLEAQDVPLQREPDFAGALLLTYINLGHLADQSNQHEDARRWYARAASLESSLAPRLPRQLRADLYIVHGGMAKSLTRLNRHTEAVAHWDRALELCQPSERQRVRFNRTITLALAGDHVPATTEAQVLAQADGADGGLLYWMAAVHAVSVKAVREDTKLAVADREALADRYAAVAIRLLERAYAAGRFKNTAQVGELEKDESFASLRTHAGFIRFLDGLRSVKPGPMVLPR